MLSVVRWCMFVGQQAGEVKGRPVVAYQRLGITPLLL